MKAADRLPAEYRTPSLETLPGELQALVVKLVETKFKLNKQEAPKGNKIGPDTIELGHKWAEYVEPLECHSYLVKYAGKTYACSYIYEPGIDLWSMAADYLTRRIIDDNPHHSSINVYKYVNSCMDHQVIRR